MPSLWKVAEMLTVASCAPLAKKGSIVVWPPTAAAAPAGTQEPGHSGGDPEVKRRQFADAGVEPGQVYADVAVSGATLGSSGSSGTSRTGNSPGAMSWWWPP